MAPRNHYLDRYYSFRFFSIEFQLHIFSRRSPYIHLSFSTLYVIYVFDTKNNMCLRNSPSKFIKCPWMVIVMLFSAIGLCDVVSGSEHEHWCFRKDSLRDKVKQKQNWPLWNHSLQMPRFWYESALALWFTYFKFHQRLSCSWNERKLDNLCQKHFFIIPLHKLNTL